MCKIYCIITFLIISTTIFAYDFEQSSESSSCVISLSMKLRPMRVEDKTGSAVIEVLLKDKSGKPISGKQIQLTATWGTFFCRIPEEKDNTEVDLSDDQSCYTTDNYGKVKVNLVNLLVGETVNVKATCDCGGYFVFATGNLSMKATTKKK